MFPRAAVEKKELSFVLSASNNMGENLVVIFDFDGTIADTINFIRTIFNFPETKNINWEELKSKETKEIFKDLGIPLIEIPFILKKVRDILHQEVEKIKPIEGIEKALFKIKENHCQLGILTSCPQKTVAKFLKINNLDFFDFVYSESNIFNKAEKLNNLLKEKKFNPQNVFYVGDETRDVEAAKKVGVKTVAVTWGFNSEKILKEKKPDYVIREPRELIALLDNL